MSVIDAPLAQQVAGERVTQPVGRHRLDLRASAGVADDRSHPTRVERPDRRVDLGNT
jgi:hypothetical protein